MTDMEEQKMIEQAKAGDPKAQFEMSQWARQMSILEPNEERWNRLAAKCLVDSAKAGYEPAKALVQALISGRDEAPEAPAEAAADDAEETRAFEPVSQTSAFDRFYTDAEDAPAAEPSSSFYDQAREEDYFSDEELDDLDDLIDYENQNQGWTGKALTILKKVGKALKKAGVAAAAVVGGFCAWIVSKIKGKAKAAKPENAAETGSRHAAPRSKKTGFAGFIEDNWPVVRIVCIAICVVLVILIVILAIPPKEEEAPVATPIPTSVPATPVPTPEPFPNEATRLEIRSTATLQYRPSDSEFLTAATTFTVTASEAENLRQGPGAGDYPEVIMQIPEGTQVTAYARHDTTDTDESGNKISWYLLNSGGTWGWMYGPSLG